MDLPLPVKMLTWTIYTIPLLATILIVAYAIPAFLVLLLSVAIFFVVFQVQL